VAILALFAQGLVPKLFSVRAAYCDVPGAESQDTPKIYLGKESKIKMIDHEYRYDDECPIRCADDGRVYICDLDRPHSVAMS
jgi:hypothetical protein